MDCAWIERERRLSSAHLVEGIFPTERYSQLRKFEQVNVMIGFKPRDNLSNMGLILFDMGLTEEQGHGEHLICRERFNSCRHPHRSGGQGRRARLSVGRHDAEEDEQGKLISAGRGVCLVDWLRP